MTNINKDPTSFRYGKSHPMASDASMIRNIVIQRVDVSFPHSVPLQWSQNRQLAVNNGTQLTVLDPKLPSLHQGVDLVNNVTILNPRDIYQVTSILHSEVLGSLSVRNFSRVIVETGDEPFQFTNINEPDIVSHRWAGVDEYTRDCDLGVLFNTGEMVVLRRETGMIDKYVVVVNIFAELSAHYGVELDNEDILVDSEQLKKIKVKNFEFSELYSNSGEKKQFLSIINDNGDILVYQLSRRSLGPELLLEISTGFNIIKQCWSDWKNLGGSLYSAYVSVVNSDNSAYVYAVVCDLNSNTFSTSPGQSFAPVSRFLKGQVKWVTTRGLSIFISTSTGRFQLTNVISDVNEKSSKLPTKYEVTVQTNSLVQKLHNYATATGIITQIEENFLSITISFENGKFEKYILDTTKFSLNDGVPSAVLTRFVSKSLFSFQLINSTAEDPGGDEVSSSKKDEDATDSSKEGDFRTYLNSEVEGVLINYGTSIVGGNIATIAFKIVPKDVLHYKIVSQSEIQIAFMKLDDAMHNEHTLRDNSTSIAKMNDIWFQHFVDIPLFGLHSENRKERLDAYLKQIDVFRLKHFVKLDEFMLVISNEWESSKEGLQASLSANFNLNPIVKQLQLRYNFEKQLFNFLIALDDVDEFLKRTVNQTISDIGHIEKLLTSHLIKIVLHYVKRRPDFENEFDKFLIVNYIKKLRELDPEGSSEFEGICDEATITISSRFFEEKFTVSVNDIAVEGESELIKSDSDHKWTKCKLTNLPLLQLNNRNDELKTFNYIMYRDGGKQEVDLGEILTQLLQTIQYCFISGNKIYAIK